MRNRMLLPAFFSLSASAALAQPGQIELSSGNALLQDSFSWAKGWALELVVPANAQKDQNPWLFHDKDQRVTQHYPFQETNPGSEWQTDPVLSQYSPTVVGSQPKSTIASYWGTYAYPADSRGKGWWQWSGGRECFCTRDICHQAVAGHLLGLGTENWSMLHHFAKGANENTRNAHWPKWSYSFFGDPYYMDADWRELPAPLELGEKLYEQYLWTGNSDYINNPDILTYHANLHSTSAFMSHQDVNGNGIADETIQLPTLWEDTHDNFIEAGDSVGCQYQALLAYAGVLEARGDSTNATTFRDKAAALRQKFHNEWFNPETQRYIRGFSQDGVWKDNWGHEGSFFMPMKLVTDQGPRTAAYIDFIFRSAYEKELNIEAKTYLPEMLYKQGRNGMGWHFLAEVMRTRNIYPEVAFTTISNTVCGLMGVRVNAPVGRVTTLPRLTHEVPWVECNHLMAGTRDLKLRHDGRARSTLTLNSGNPIIWTAQFPGAHARIKVNGVWVNARQEKESGQTVSSVDVTLSSPGQVAIAEVNDDAGFIPLGDLTPMASSGTVQHDGLPGSERPMMLAGKFVERGLSLRSDQSSVTYNLANPCVRFTADLGVDDSSAADNSVEFVILKDDVEAYRSGPLARGQRKPIELSLVGCQKLQVKLEAATSTTALVADAKLHLGVQAADEAAASVAASLRMPEIAKDARQLPLPVAPSGFQVTLEESSDVALVSQAGVIAPPELDTLINLTFKITKTSDSSTAITSAITAIVPARTPDTAALAARFIKSVPAPLHGQTSIPLPAVPNGFTVRMVESSDHSVIGLDGSIHQMEDYRSVTIVYEVTMTSDGSTARTAPLAVTVPARDFARIDKLTWKSATASFGSPVRGSSVGGNPLRLAGTTYASGIGTHAESSITYQLDGKYSRMEVLVGVDDGQQNAGSVQFEILGDGRSLARSGILRGTADNSLRAANIAADLTGVNELVLKVSDGGDGINSDHADWVEGKLFHDLGLVANDAATTNQDTPVTIAVLSNDRAWNGGAGSIQSVTQGAHGGVTIQGVNVVYTPASNWSGTDTFTYTANDGLGGSATASVTVTVTQVNPVNSAPVFTVNPISRPNAASGAAYSGTIAGTASDADGDPFTYSKIGGPAWLTVAADGALSGTPTSADRGNNSWTVRVTDDAGASSDANLRISVDAPSLPFNLTSADIGSVGVSGSTSASGGTFTLSGSGADIWDAADAFHFASTTLTGDGEILARVTSQTDSDTWAKAGVMIRDDASAGAKNAMMTITPGGLFTFQWRVATGGASDYVRGSATNPAPNNWVRLIRSGTNITGYASADGTNWTQVGQQTISMAASVQVGLAVTSHNNSATSTAVFDQVSITPYDAPPPVTNHAPVFTANPLGKSDAVAGSTYTDTIANAATDEDGDSLSYAKVSGPAWLGIAANGALSGTPASADLGGNSWVVRVTDSAGAATDAVLNLTVKAPPFPANWNRMDIGPVGMAGSSSELNGTFTVSGCGTDIYNSADSFQFAYTTLDGDGEIRARVTSQTNTSGWAKAGVMIRETTAANSRNAMMALTPGNGFTFQSRVTSGGGSAMKRGPAKNAEPNNWVRLTRSGTVIAGYTSADGVTWAQTGTYVIGMASSVKVGLAVTSNNNSAQSTATFDNVSVTPFPPPWQSLDVGTSGAQGRAEYFAAAYTLKGAGNISGTADNFRYVYQILNGDGEIRVRVRSLQNSGTAARLGVMIRGSLATGSPYAFVGVNGAGTYRWQYRQLSDAANVTGTGGTGTVPNVWLRLVRSGNTVSGYRSVNGVDWTPVGSASMTLGGNIYIGMADASGKTGSLNTTVFDSVSVEP